MAIKLRLLIPTIALSLVSSAYAADSNQSLNITGILRNGQGVAQSMAITLIISLYDSPSAKSPFFTQTFENVVVDNGFFSVELAGSTLSLAGVPDAWVGIRILGDSTELSRTHLDAAPYALSCTQADNATTLGGMNLTQLLPVAVTQSFPFPKEALDVSPGVHLSQGLQVSITPGAAKGVFMVSLSGQLRQGGSTTPSIGLGIRDVTTRKSSANNNGVGGADGNVCLSVVNGWSSCSMMWMEPVQDSAPTMHTFQVEYSVAADTTVAMYNGDLSVLWLPSQ
jgi:hypothetical protein